jgi:hypothetical protein
LRRKEGIWRRENPYEVRHTYKLSIANSAYIRDVLISFFLISNLILKKIPRLSRLESDLKVKGQGYTI